MQQLPDNAKSLRARRREVRCVDALLVFQALTTLNDVEKEIGHGTRVVITSCYREMRINRQSQVGGGTDFY